MLFQVVIRRYLIICDKKTVIKGLYAYKTDLYYYTQVLLCYIMIIFPSKAISPIDSKKEKPSFFGFSVRFVRFI